MFHVPWKGGLKFKLRRNGQDAPFPGYRKMNEDGLDKEKDWKGIWEKGGKRRKT